MWEKYPSIKRIDHEEADHVLNGPDIYIEPKLDGANASVYWDASVKYVRVAKRSGPLTDEDKGFRGLEDYINDNKDNFGPFFRDNPHLMIYGEWLIKHTIGYYSPKAYKHFYAFDVFDVGTSKFLPPMERNELLSSYDILAVPVMDVLKGPKQAANIERYVEQNTFLIEQPDKIGEGIVIKCFDDREPVLNKFGRVAWAKMVRPAFQEKCKVEFPPDHPQKNPEQAFIRSFVTQARIEKIKQKIMDSKETGWRSEYIGEVLGRAWNDVFSEELWDFVKKNKIGAFNFKLAQSICIQHTKSFLGL